MKLAVIFLISFVRGYTVDRYHGQPMSMVSHPEWDEDLPRGQVVLNLSPNINRNKAAKYVIPESPRAIKQNIKRIKHQFKERDMLTRLMYEWGCKEDEHSPGAVSCSRMPDIIGMLNLTENQLERDLFELEEAKPDDVPPIRIRNPDEESLFVKKAIAGMDQSIEAARHGRAEQLLSFIKGDQPIHDNPKPSIKDQFPDEEIDLIREGKLSPEALKGSIANQDGYVFDPINEKYLKIESHPKRFEQRRLALGSVRVKTMRAPSIGIHGRIGGGSECTLKAKDGDILILHYRASTKDSVVIGDSTKSGHLLTFKLGKTYWHPGLNEGPSLHGMCVGEERQILLPGRTAQGKLNPNDPDEIFHLGKFVLEAKLLKLVRGTNKDPNCVNWEKLEKFKHHSYNCYHEESAPDNTVSWPASVRIGYNSDGEIWMNPAMPVEWLQHPESRDEVKKYSYRNIFQNLGRADNGSKITQTGMLSILLSVILFIHFV